MKPLPQHVYVKELRSAIPKAAFKLASYKLIYMFCHAFVVFACIALNQIFSSVVVLTFGGVVAGLSIACIFLYTHELSHGTIIRKEPYYYLSKLFFWSFSGIPPTVWKKVHNLSHHKFMNTYKDPDRKTFKSEASFWNNIYNLFIYPNKKLRYSFTVGFAMIFYSLKHVVAVFYSSDKSPAIVTYRPNYTKSEKQQVAFEMLFITAFWAVIIISLGALQGIVFALISWITYSASVILFIITQHQRDPVFQSVADPLLTATSVIIPKWLDRIIDWHSFHVEHHLFPGINFDYYPKISRAIEEKYPEKYERIPLIKAVQECYNEDVLIEDPLI